MFKRSIIATFCIGFVGAPSNAAVPVLAEQRTKFGDFGRFCKVVDNPPIPVAVKDKYFTVVIVAENERCREQWSVEAREHYGKSAFIFNDVFNISDLAKVLKQFPKGSIKRLVFGGHDGGPSADRGIFMGIDEVDRYGRTMYRSPAGTENIEVTNLQKPEHRQNAQTIREALALDPSVEIQSCGVGKYLNVVKTFATIFQATVWACTGDVFGWDDANGPSGGKWISEIPQTQRQMAADRSIADLQQLLRDIKTTNQVREGAPKPKK